MYNACGSKPDLNGRFYENNIVIQYDKDLIEVWDEAKRLRCEWYNDYEKGVTKPPIRVSDLEVVELNFRGENAEREFSSSSSDYTSSFASGDFYFFSVSFPSRLSDPSVSERNEITRNKQKTDDCVACLPKTKVFQSGTDGQATRQGRSS